MAPLNRRIECKLVKAFFRILFNSFRLAWRAHKRFWAFIVIYGFLIGMVAYLLPQGAMGALIGIMGGVVVATLYGFILTHFRKNEIAALKCIGWSNGNLRTLIVGEILLISCLAFFLFVEIGVHIIGFTYYTTGSATTRNLLVPSYIQDVFLGAVYLPLAFIIVVLAQIPGILLAYWRILAVKPMVALRMT